MNAELLPPTRPLDDDVVARMDAVSSAFLERMEKERREAQRGQSRRVVALPVDVFEDGIVLLVG